MNHQEMMHAMANPAAALASFTDDLTGVVASADANRRAAAFRNATAQFEHHDYNLPGRFINDSIRMRSGSDPAAMSRLDSHGILRFALADIGTGDTVQGGTSNRVHAEAFYLPRTGWLAALATVVPAPQTANWVPPLADFGPGATVDPPEKSTITTTIPSVAAVPPIDTTVATGGEIPLAALTRDPIYTDQFGLALLNGVDRKLEATIAGKLAPLGTPVAGNDIFAAMFAAAAAAGDRLGDVVILAGVAAGGRIAERLAGVGLIGNLHGSTMIPSEIAYVAAPRGVTVLVSAAQFAEQVDAETLVGSMVAYRMSGSFLRAAGALQVLTTTAGP